MMPHEEEIPIIGEELMGKYNVGDIVKYYRNILNEGARTGIILKVHTIELSGRRHPHADVYVFGEDTHETVLLGTLKVVHNIEESKK